MSTSNAPMGETLEHAVARLLRTVPQAWTEYDGSALSALEERALFLLTGAGMIERRTSLRLQMFGHPVAVEATITVTGECGFAEAVKYIPARMQEYWREAYETRKASGQGDGPAFHCERIGNEQWRLTAEGLLARDDLDKGNSSTVFDFVLMRGFFDGRPRLMPDGRISRREPVRGQGKLEKMTLVNSNAAPAGVSVANWEDGAKAFAAAFAELVKSHFTTPSATPDAPVEQGEGEKPANESAPNSPTGFLGGDALADALGIPAARRQAFFQQLGRKRLDLGDDCWCEVADSLPNRPRFLYRMDSPKLRDLASEYKSK